MSSASSDQPTVLVVEDEEQLADLYADYLSDAYDVRTAYGGVGAMELLSADLDVALVDRRMPVVSGNDVVAEVEDRGLDCRVGMVTAVDPDVDVIEMGCDDYIVKPVTRDRLRDLVERLLAVAEYDERMRELSAKRLNRNVLEVEQTPDQLDGSEQFQSLVEDIERLEAEINEIAEELEVESLREP